MESFNQNVQTSETIESERELVEKEEIKYRETLEWARQISKMENPLIISTGYSHLARFKKNNQDYWYLTKEKATDLTKDQIDIMEFEDGYLYYIQENRFEYLLYSRDLFYDFNKSSTKYGDLCRTADAACRLKSNLNGYYWEINNLNATKISKCEYFQNFYGNEYTSQFDGINNMVIRIINFNRKQIIVANSFNTERQNGHQVIRCSLGLIKDSSNISNDELNMLLADVERTNPQDLKEMKQIFKR